MMKRSKKYIKVILIIGFMLLTLFPTSKANAQTLQQYKNALAELKNKKHENDSLTAESERKIREKRNSIIEATNTIEENENKVESSKLLVADSQEKIKIRQEEMKEVLVALQYTDSNSKELYTDYIFSASSITEMIERQAIVEQVVEYTQAELESLDKLIKENESLQVKLAQDNVELNSSITKYEAQLVELDKYIDSLASIGLDYDSKIEAHEGMIRIYEAAGCKNNDDLDDCYYSGGSGSFARPLTKGSVSQPWNPTHGGIDLAVSAGSNVYAPANGTIVYTKYRWNCGGNIIYMHTVVDGKKYTVELAHLRSIKVRIGQTVKKGELIATSGGDRSTWSYDTCTSGPHLHYAISSGHYFGNASWEGFYTFKANTRPTSNQNISGLKNRYGWRWSTR